MLAVATSLEWQFVMTDAVIQPESRPMTTKMYPRSELSHLIDYVLVCYR